MRKRRFTKQVGLILSDEEHQQLIEQTNKEELTISQWIREAIREKLWSEPKKERRDSDEPNTNFNNVQFQTDNNRDLKWATNLTKKGKEYVSSINENHLC